MLGCLRCNQEIKVGYTCSPCHERDRESAQKLREFVEEMSQAPCAKPNSDGDPTCRATETGPGRRPWDLCDSCRAGELLEELDQ